MFRHAIRAFGFGRLVTTKALVTKDGKNILGETYGLLGCRGFVSPKRWVERSQRDGDSKDQKRASRDAPKRQHAHTESNSS